MKGNCGECERRYTCEIDPDKCNEWPDPTSKTNADRIRAMSDEELADWMARTQIANVAEALEVAKIPWEKEDGLKDEVKKEVLEWLQQPVEPSDSPDEDDRDSGLVEEE